jgi:hypothetical protein
MTTNEVIEKAYGNIPKEVGINFETLAFMPSRSIKYYWILLVRKFTR